MSQLWVDQTFVGFDLETSGAYPLAAEICEVAAVKWHKGQIVDEFQSLVRVERPMSDAVIKIHHITNEMLVGAPDLGTVVRQFREFAGEHYLMAHHAPFDMGFLAPAMEKGKLVFPKTEVFCTSLLSRKVYPESTNHKLQTLISFFQLPQGEAHRALDDARACLRVGLKVFERLGPNATIDDIFKAQNAHLPWGDYAIQPLRAHRVLGRLVEAVETQQQVQIVYAGGSRPGQPRTVTPLGIVRNPLDDYFVAVERLGDVPKRYFLNKITAANF